MSDIKFRIGADNSEFNKGLQNAESRGKAFGAAMDDVGKKLSRTFGAGDVFKGLLQGLGIGSVERIADLLATPLRRAADIAKEFLSFTDRATIATLRLLSLNRTDDQNLEVMKREEASLARQLESYQERKLNEKESIEAERVKAELAEKSLAIFAIESRIAERSASKEKELAAAKAAIADKEWRMMQVVLDDENKRTVLLEKARELYQDAKFLREDDIEKQKIILRALDLENEANVLAVKIEQDKERAAKEAADEMERQRKETERQRKEAERLNEQLLKAKENREEAEASLRDARREEFTFTLADAAGGSRGSPAARGKSRIVGQKEAQMRAILDRGGYSVEFDDSGKPRLTHSDPTKQRDAAQANARFGKLYSDRNAIKGSIANLTASEKDPFADNIKAVEKATKEAVEVLKEIQKSKFANQ
jgi:hypothetical protein